MLTLGNYTQNPSDDKFKKINTENVNFKNRVGDIIGGKVLLKEAGFHEEGTFLVADEKCLNRAKDLLHQVEDTLSKMN